MKLCQISPRELRRWLHGHGLWLRSGPFSVCIQSRIDTVADGLWDLYGHFEVRDSREGFADFHISLDYGIAHRRWIRPQVEFSFDGIKPFKPLPAEQAYPLFEWGLNWCIATQAHQYLMVHAAVVEKNGRALLMPAPPGSGKSTLTAALVLSGWRLLSDELALVDRTSGLVYPLARPVSLKNASIRLIKTFSREAFVNTPTFDTAKGTVAHLRPPRESVRRQHEPAKPAWIVFPRWSAQAEPNLTARPRASTFMFLAENAFNYSTLGTEGFRVATHLVAQCDCYDFEYSQLSDAVRIFDALADSDSDALQPS